MPNRDEHIVKNYSPSHCHPVTKIGRKKFQKNTTEHENTTVFDRKLKYKNENMNRGLPGCNSAAEGNLGVF